MPWRPPVLTIAEIARPMHLASDATQKLYSVKTFRTTHYVLLAQTKKGIALPETALARVSKYNLAPCCLRWLPSFRLIPDNVAVPEAKFEVETMSNTLPSFACTPGAKGDFTVTINAPAGAQVLHFEQDCKPPSMDQPFYDAIDDADRLFNSLGSMLPSLDISLLDRLVLRQWEVACWGVRHIPGYVGQVQTNIVHWKDATGTTIENNFYDMLKRSEVASACLPHDLSSAMCAAEHFADASHFYFRTTNKQPVHRTAGPRHDNLHCVKHTTAELEADGTKEWDLAVSGYKVCILCCLLQQNQSNT